MAQRRVLVTLAVLAGILLLWTVATWPSLPTDGGTPEDAASAARDEAAADSAEYQVPPPQAPTTLAAAPPPSAAEPEPEPEPEVQVPAQPAELETPEAQADKLFVRENGPLSDYKQKFASEPRDSAASDAEVAIRGAFHPTDGPQPVFRAVLCRETICKIETRISAKNLGGYVAAMTRIVHDKFDSKLATERTSLVEAGEVSVVVYVKRPSHAQP